MTKPATTTTETATAPTAPAITATTNYTGATLLAKLLERQGIRHLPGIPGGAILPFYDALHANPRIRHILARHEQGAGFIAQGIARATGRAAACVATSGPGATNLLTAIADARLDSIPLVAITGQVTQNLIGTDAFQEVDTYGLTVPITKHNYLVRDVRELLTIVPEAFTIAESGRPGPVVIDIPKDVQTAPIALADTDLPPPGGRHPVPPATDADIAALARMMTAARRPLLYLGGGIIAANASSLARDLARRLDAPVVLTLNALGAIPADDPSNMGMLGMHGTRATHTLLDECDLLIAIGARFDDRATGKVAEFCPNAAIAHIDIDRAEFGKIKRPALSVEADAADVLRRLLEMLKTETAGRADSPKPPSTPNPPSSPNATTPNGGFGDSNKANKDKGTGFTITPNKRTVFTTALTTVPTTPNTTTPNGGFGETALPSPSASWLARAIRLRDAHPLRHPPRDAAPLHPINLCRHLAATLPPDTIVTTDVGQHQMWVAQAWPFRAPRTLLTSGGFGTMGFGMPAAIGAALSLQPLPPDDPLPSGQSLPPDESLPPDQSLPPDESHQPHPPGSARRVVCISGDGSLLMNIQELATLADHQLPVAVLVFNNAQLGLVHQQQELFYGKHYSASVFETTPDFAAIARAFGIRGHRIAPDAADPLAEIAAALAQPGPCVIDIPIDTAEKVLPMVPPGAANRQSIETTSALSV